jgi:site-specific recombinase XerC
LHFKQITAADITVFVQRQAALVTSKRAQLVVTALRSFLRYLFLRGMVAIDLAMCVPTIATWSLSNVPRFLAGEQIQKILASCDKETGIGKRDRSFASRFRAGGATRQSQHRSRSFRTNFFLEKSSVSRMSFRTCCRCCSR